jgi:hypothetical protein
MNLHLLHCARTRLTANSRNHMQRQFAYVRVCRWNDCFFTFKGKHCGTSSLHMTRHIVENESHQCLWNGCDECFESQETLSYHVSDKHRVPTEWTTLTKMHYCFEHNQWFRSNCAWDAHLKTNHLLKLNDFCGLIRQGGVVIAAAHCLFCIGNSMASLSDRFAQFSDMFVLHKHLRGHLADAVYPFQCPHPLCSDNLDSEDLFWEHAVSVHGTPPVGVPRILGKRKSRYDDSDLRHE